MSKLVLTTYNAFRAIGMSSPHKIVHLVGLGDIHPRFDVKFPAAKEVWLDHCDKNFVYYWLYPSNFPQVERIYLNSHPCEYRVMHRFSSDVQIFLSSHYSSYKTRWADDLPHVTIADRPADQSTGCILT